MECWKCRWRRVIVAFLLAGRPFWLVHTTVLRPGDGRGWWWMIEEETSAEMDRKNSSRTSSVPPKSSGCPEPKKSGRPVPKYMWRIKCLSENIHFYLKVTKIRAKIRFQSVNNNLYVYYCTVADTAPVSLLIVKCLKFLQRWQVCWVLRTHQLLLGQWPIFSWSHYKLLWYRIGVKP